MIGVVLALSLAKTTISLAALGYPDGIPLTGGAVSLRLPVLPGLQRLDVRFPIAARGSLAHARVTLEIDGREVAAASGDHLHDATLRADVAMNGRHESAVEITVRSRLAECSTDAMPQMRVAASGSVSVTQAAGASRSPRSYYGASYTVVEPPHLDAPWQGRALVAAYALHVIAGWRRVGVSLGATPAPGAARVADLGAVRLPDRPPPKGTIDFSRLGVLPLEQSGENVRFAVPFTLGELGAAPERLLAELALRAGAAGRLRAAFNGREVNTIGFAAGTHMLRVPLRESSLRGVNLLLLDVRFDHPQSFCRANAPSVTLANTSALHWSGQADLPSTVELQLGALSGAVTLETDPAIFPHAFAVMSALGSINRSIDRIEVQPLGTQSPPGPVIEIGAPPDIDPPDGGSYGEVRVEPGDRILVSYVGDASVLDRLPEIAPLLASADATHFEFGKSGAVLVRGGLPRTRAQMRQRFVWAIYAAFAVALVAGLAIVAFRARRFS